VAIGANNVSAGQGAVASGNVNLASGQGAVALGDSNAAVGKAAIALGQGSSAIGAGATAIGQSANAAASNTIAIGTASQATQPNASAYGAGAAAYAPNSTAIGAGASVMGNGVSSTAIGVGATTSVPHNIVLGTVNETTTIPGISSDLSQFRQSGLLGVVTTDQFGNLASDGGALYRQNAAIKAGAAVAMALSDPVLTENQRFGLKMSVGGFDGSTAVGLSAAGVVARKIFTQYDSLTVSAAGGYGQASVSGYSKNTFGVRGSVQFAW
jgi:trimeric autotransporter adhesin